MRARYLDLDPSTSPLATEHFALSLPPSLLWFPSTYWAMDKRFSCAGATEASLTDRWHPHTQATELHCIIN